MQVRFQNKHTAYMGGECVEWTLNVYDELWLSSTISPFDVDASGFIYSVQSPELGPTAKFGLMASSVEFNVHVGEDDGIIDQWISQFLPLAQENRFHLEILKGEDVWWRGTILMDAISIPVDKCPYIARLTFTDGLSYLKGLEDTNVIGNADRAVYVQWMQEALKNIPAIQLWSDDSIFMYTYVQWFEFEQAINQDPLFDLDLIGIGPLYEFDADTGEYKSVSVFEQLNRLCYSFHLRLLQCNGVWHFQQVSQMPRSTMQRYGYSKVDYTGLNFAQFQLVHNETVTLKTVLNQGRNAGFPNLSYGGVYDYLPALKRVNLRLNQAIDAPVVERLIRNVQSDGIVPFNGRENTVINLGRVVSRPGFGLRVSGRIRFKDMLGLPFPTQNFAPYPINGENFYRCRMDVFIDGTLYGSKLIYTDAAVKMFTDFELDPVTNTFVQSWYNELEFDFEINTQIPATGNLSFLVKDEVRSVTLFGNTSAAGQYINTFMDVRMNVNYQMLSNFSTSEFVTYSASNPSAIKSSQLFEEEIHIGDTYFQGNLIDPNSGQISMGVLRVVSTLTLTEKWQVNQQGEMLPLVQILAREILAMQRLPIRKFRFQMQGDYDVIDRLDFDNRIFLFNQGSFSSYDMNWQVNEAIELVKNSEGINDLPSDIRSREALGPVSVNDTGRVLGELSGGITVLNEIPQGVVESITINVPGGIGAIPTGGRIVLNNQEGNTIDVLEIVGPPEQSGGANDFQVSVSGNVGALYGPGTQVLLPFSPMDDLVKIYTSGDELVVVQNQYNRGLLLLDANVNEQITLSANALPGVKVILFNNTNATIDFVSTTFLNNNPSTLAGRSAMTVLKIGNGWVVISTS